MARLKSRYRTYRDGGAVAAETEEASTDALPSLQSEDASPALRGQTSPEEVAIDALNMPPQAKVRIPMISPGCTDLISPRIPR